MCHVMNIYRTKQSGHLKKTWWVCVIWEVMYCPIMIHTTQVRLHCRTSIKRATS